MDYKLGISPRQTEEVHRFHISFLRKRGVNLEGVGHVCFYISKTFQMAMHPYIGALT